LPGTLGGQRDKARLIQANQIDACPAEVCCSKSISQLDRQGGIHLDQHDKDHILDVGQHVEFSTSLQDFPQDSDQSFKFLLCRNVIRLSFLLIVKGETVVNGPIIISNIHHGWRRKEAASYKGICRIAVPSRRAR